MPGRAEFHAPIPRVVFLPGVSGHDGFWRAVGDRLPAAWRKAYVNWPGLGDEPHESGVRGFDDLVARVLDALDEPGDLVAQSMGGVIAVRAATRAPTKVRRLVLAATSGGVDGGALGAADWREEYRLDFPDASGWATDPQPEMTAELRALKSPTLLLWGDADPLSPVAIGEHIAGLIPDAVLHVVAGGTHDFGRDRADVVAPLIEAHLR
jgi:pimeloyl-ACP methyl ester carboxylesterase